MSEIRIPAAALEAGAKTLCSRAGYEWTVTPDVHNHWRAQARAAFLAMLEAWPNKESLNKPSDWHRYVVLCISEKTDDKA